MIRWSREAFPNNKRVIEEMMQEIAKLQEEEVTEESYKKIKESIEELSKVWKREEKYWMQRSRIKWLKEEDRNKKFFHQSTV